MTDDDLSRMINNNWNTGFRLAKIGRYWYDTECWRCCKTIEKEIRDTGWKKLTRWHNVSNVSWACWDCCKRMLLQADA
jgi:hypothetical protein